MTGAESDVDPVRFFVLKAKTRAPIEESRETSVWATRSHARCSDADQPHARFDSARDAGRVRVCLLIFEDSEHAWMGFANLQGEAWCEAENDFPNHFRLDWRVLLPQAQGVGFRAVHIACEQEAHKVHTGDELSNEVGRAVQAAIEDAAARVRLEEEAKQRSLEESAFILAQPGESEPDTHRRLLRDVERRLGPVLLACLCGSRRYNLHFEDSDWDLLVVYAARDPTSAPVTIKNPAVLHPDYTIREVGSFVEMLLSGDPRNVECLFLELSAGVGASEERGLNNASVLQYGQPWTSIMASRDQFLSRSMVKKYLSDATGRQGTAAVRKGAKPGKHHKIMYIAFRSLTNALQVCSRQAPRIWRPDDCDERGKLLAIRRGEAGSVLDLLADAELLADEVRQKLETSSLPETPARDAAEAWLREVRIWSAVAGEGEPSPSP